ncbi:hypothetical protein SUGI_1392490 [Cryptomeria japonica]|uniref:Uncharacterized protein n=1 Tax=Cryptomeria japonica TaxID=3369 RepID=A0AAD3RQA7_CRYJA|nr:hypothetical protein SUGI_1392490 [Cryptomeria japonica]
MGLGTHLWSLGPILHPETCVVLERICGPWVPFCIPKLVFWCLIPILGAHLAPSAHPRGKPSALVHRGKIERAPEAPPNMHQGALGPHVSAGRCARGWCVGTGVADGTLQRTRRPLQVHARRPGRVHTRRPSKVRAPGQGSHLANGAHFAREGVHLDGGGWRRGGFARGSRFAKYTLRQAHNGCDHTSISAPDPIRTPQLSALGPE